MVWQLVGAYFQSHPAIQNATVRMEDRTHPSTALLPATWPRLDEWYNCLTNPRPNVQVLATLDERTYSGGTMGADHPIAWCRAFDGGHSWYTGGGHTLESFSDANFRTRLLGGIRYATQGAGDCGVGSGQLVQVTSGKGVPETGEPMGLTVRPNYGVLHTSREGEHDVAVNIFGVFDAEYTDNLPGGVPALTTHAKTWHRNLRDNIVPKVAVARRPSRRLSRPAHPDSRLD